MSRLYVFAAIASLCLAACADQPAPTSGLPVRQSDGITSPAHFTFVEGEYPTQEEYLAAGGSLTGEVSYISPTGQFSSDLSAWSSSGKVSFLNVNGAQASLSATIIDFDGRAINSGQDTYVYGSTLPILSTVTKTLAVTISTNNHSCGITGKARLLASASLKLIPNSTHITEIWSGGLDRSSPDVTLPECTTEEEWDTGDVQTCDGMIVDDASECEADEGEGGGGSGGGGGVGHGAVCELWEIITYESTDGGDTWYEVGRRYEVRNCR